MAKLRREGKCMRCASTEHRIKKCTEAEPEPPLEKHCRRIYGDQIYRRKSE